VAGHGSPLWGRRWWLPAWCALLAVLVMLPLVRPGFVLSYDMVTVPDQDLTRDALGLGSALPRAVPQDAVLAVLTAVLPGAVVYRVILVLIVFVAALGAGRLLPGPTAVQMVAASAYAWNAYVAERLVIGHWTLLVAYAVLPWLFRAALSLRTGRRESLPAALLLVAAASITPTGGVLASAVLVLTVLVPHPADSPARWRLQQAATVAGCLLLQLPWVMPAVLTPTRLTSDPAAVELFAAHSDSPLGLLGSALTLGGIWNSDAVPDSRALVSAAVVTVAWVSLALAGAGRVARVLGRTAALVLAVLASAGLVLGLAVGPVLTAAVELAPGAGLLRDGHKFLAWYALALAPAVALGAARLASWVAHLARDRVPATAVLAVAAVLPLAAMPDLAWGVGGRLIPVEYPRSWQQVRATLQAEPDAGALVVVPYQPFRSFPWNDRRTTLDPLPRFAGVDVVRPDTLTVGTTRLAGEDPRAAAVAVALASDNPVRGLLDVGVGWVAVEHDTPGVVPEGLTDDLVGVVASAEVDLYRVPGDPVAWTATAPAGPVLAADLAAVTLVVGCVCWVVLIRRRTQRGRIVLVQSA
jgi:hypothetical protein